MFQFLHKNTIAMRFFNQANLKIIFNSGRRLFTTSVCVLSKDENKDVIRPRRAILYIPGHDSRKIEKLKTLTVDCAVLDCEDGVALNKKTEARQMICKTVESVSNFGRTEIAVRINSIDTEFATDDLMAILSCKKLPDTLMIPKVDTVEHVSWLFDKFNSHLNYKQEKKMNLIFFVESAKSLLDLREICSKSVSLCSNMAFNLAGLVFGSDDFCADIGAVRSESAMELLTARQLFVLVSKSFKLQAIDMVHINYKDEVGLKKSCEDSARMGFTGKQVIHPNQIPIVQRAFSPSTEKVEWAKELIKLFKQHQNEGKGAFSFRGAMIDKPLLLQAEYIVKLSDSLEN